MPTYNYKAVDQVGQPAQGQIDAQNEIDLELRLERIGLNLITYRQAKKNTSVFSNRKVSLKVCRI